MYHRAVRLYCLICFFVHTIYRNTRKIKHPFGNYTAGYIEISSWNSHRWKLLFMRRIKPIWRKAEACKLCALEILVYFYLLIWHINILSYSQVTTDSTSSQLRFSIYEFLVFISRIICTCSRDKTLQFNAFHFNNDDDNNTRW
jgi:hypothetical protein